MKCPYCGNEIPDRIEQCNVCGVKLTQEDRFRSMNGTTSAKTLDKFGGGYFLFCGLIIIGFGIAWTVIVSKMLAIAFFPMYGFAVIGLGIMTYGISYLLTGIDLFTGTNRFDKTINTLTTVVSSVMLGGFAVFWFGVLILADYQILTHPEENGGYQTFLFTLIFWVVGILLIVNNIRKKKK